MDNGKSIERINQRLLPIWVENVATGQVETPYDVGAPKPGTGPCLSLIKLVDGICLARAASGGPMLLSQDSTFESART
jgi:hypothetical protein